VPTLDELMLEAVNTDDVEAVRDLLARGASPDTADEDDEPLWSLAITNDQVAVVDALLCGGCEPNPREALQQVRGEAMLACLLKHGFDINASEDDNSTTLYGMQTATLVEAFLAAGADPNLSTDNHETPLSFHASWGNLEVVNRLLDHGADPNYIDPEINFSILDYAASHGNRNIVEALLSAGADLHRSCDGWSALTIALKGGHFAVAELLVSRGAQLSERDREELTSLAARVLKLGAED